MRGLLLPGRGAPRLPPQRLLRAGGTTRPGCGRRSCAATGSVRGRWSPYPETVAGVNARLGVSVFDIDRSASNFVLVWGVSTPGVGERPLGLLQIGCWSGQSCTCHRRTSPHFGETECQRPPNRCRHRLHCLVGPGCGRGGVRRSCRADRSERSHRWSVSDREHGLPRQRDGDVRQARRSRWRLVCGADGEWTVGKPKANPGQIQIQPGLSRS